MNQSFYRSAFSVSFFSCLSFAVDYSYQLVDVYWAARLGVGAPTAIVVVASVFFLIFVANNVVGASSVALFAQAFGRGCASGDMGETGRVIFQTLVFKFFLGLVFVLLFWGFLRWGVGIFSTDPVEVQYIWEYGGVLWVSLILFSLHTSCMTALRSIGEARVTLWVSLVAFGVNVVVSPALMFGWWGAPELGIAGAAWATILAQVLAISLAFWGLNWNRAGVRVLRLCYFRLDCVLEFGVYRQLVLIGLPVLGMMVLQNFEQTFLTGILAQHDSLVSDGFGIGARIYGLLFMLNFGVLIGVSVTVGQFLGRDAADVVYRAVPKFLLGACGVAGVLSGLVAWFAPQLVGVFSSNVVSVEVGASYLRFMALVNVVVCARSGLSAVFGGAGRNQPVLVAAVVMFLLVEFPLLWVFREVGVGSFYVLWLIVLLGAVVGMVVLGWYFWARRWVPNGA